MLVDHWPLLGLRLRTGDLELRLPTDGELAELADLAARGVSPAGLRTFLTPWTDRPPAKRARAVVQGHWTRLGTWTPDDWSLGLAVFDRGRPVGMQNVAATQFGVRREVRSWSWLGLAHQGRGIGTRMRAAVLHLAFAGLGAEQATTESFVDNPAPLTVSRKLGYQPDGISRDVLHGKVVVSQRLRLTREDWETTTRPEVTVEGLPPCLADFGADYG